ncbi:hypothetical protein BGZ46_005942, partial [Entomortierella lignicola]
TQPVSQPGPYSGDALLQSQGIQFQSHQDQSQHSGNAPGIEGASYDNNYIGTLEDQQHAHQKPHDESGQPDGYYPHNSANYDSSSNALSSGPIQLPPNGALGGSVDGENSDGITNLSNSSGELSTDIRKLQDELVSWRRSQEAAQAKIAQLRSTLTAKSQENRELHTSLTQVTQDRLTLQELVHKRDKEIHDLRSKYLNDVRQIRATDDDHFTIEQRIRLLQAAILQLTKSSAGDRAANLNVEGVQQLVKKKYRFGNTQPYILNMFLEKYIMDALLEEVFNGPFYVGHPLAKEYSSIHKWMVDNNFADQAVRFRQQFCFLSVKSPDVQAHALEEAARISKIIESRLELLYNNWAGQQK